MTEEAAVAEELHVDLRAVTDVEPERGLARAGVLANVRQRLAGDPEQLGFDLRWKRADVGDVDAHAHAGVGREPA